MRPRIPLHPDVRAHRAPATDASASSVETTNWPYHGYAENLVEPQILLHPPDVQAPTDPDQAAIQQTQALLGQIARSLRLISAPWLIEPPDAESYHVAQGITMPAVSANYSVVCLVTVPPGRNGVLNQIANVVVGGAWSDFSGDAVWQLVRNPVFLSAGPPMTISATGIIAAERNYENILASLGTVAAPADISPIRVFENDVIALVIKNVRLPVAGEEVGALLGGYFYPRTWDDQYEAQSSKVAW
jgi:hypothetical protein